MTTKREMFEQFPEMVKRLSLFERYFWDSRDGVKPDAQVRERTKHGDRVKISVYATGAAHGGYVVIEWTPGVPQLIYWEHWSNLVDGMSYCLGECELAYKRAVENLRRALATKASEVQS